MICGRWKTALLATLGVAALLGTSAAFASRTSYFTEKGIYDCTSPSINGGVTYDYSFQFKPHKRYSDGFDMNGRLTGKVQSGTYKLAGRKILGVSGPLETFHESLLIEKSDLALLDKHGQLTSVGCRKHGGPGGQGGGAGNGSVPFGDYTCYHTEQYSSTGYSTAFHAEIHLYADGTYGDGDAVRAVSHWHESGSQAVFTSGPLWVDGAHDIGDYHSTPVSMPHAQGAFANETFTFVVRDTEREGGIPPYEEFSATDGVNGAQTEPMSWDYCTKTG